MHDENSDIFAQWLDRLHLTGPLPCAYYLGKTVRLKAFISSFSLNPSYIDFLLSRGYRRSGDLYYQNHCTFCQLCLSYRLPLAKFQQWSRWQKKILRRSFGLNYYIKNPLNTRQKKEIYLEYQYHKHYKDPGPGYVEHDRFRAKDYLHIMHEQLYKNCYNSMEIEIWDEQVERLVAFGIMDLGEKAISAIYIVFDRAYSRYSPGSLAILRMIEWAWLHGYDYLYLGFFIPRHPKMDYKFRYQPAEILDTRTMQWREGREFMREIFPHYPV